MSYSAYSEYKDSGVEWVHEMPKHWGVRPFKFMARIKNGKDYKDVKVSEPGFPVIGSGGQFAYASKYLFKGESVLLGRKGTIDKPLYINGSFWTVDTMFYTEISRNTSPKYLYNCALTIKFDYFSTSTAVPSMTQEDLGNIVFPCPDIEEQTQIATFLDRETQKIDRLIEKQQQLIKLLQEKRQAVISHAVTKGLNPDAKMKESGIEWLGEVPEHWGIKRLKDVLVEPMRNGLFKKKDLFGTGSLLVNVSDLYVDDYFINVKALGRVRTTPEERGVYKVCSGDVFFVRSSLKVEGIGRSACFSEDYDDVVFECHIVNAKPNRKQISSRYLIRYLNSQPVSHEFVRRSKTTTMTTIDQGNLATISVVIPPKYEQLEIDNYLDQQLEKIHLTDAYAAKFIKLLKERRTALISAAVTGKIDVRNIVNG